VKLITRDEDLREAVSGWDSKPWVTLDTEFVREDTYYPKLSLIQLGDESEALCVDMLAVADVEPLKRLFAAEGTVKVLHSPSQDLEIFLHRIGAMPKPMFDTQLAATMLGMADQPGYAALVEAMLGVRLDKSLSRTPWLRRPLNEAELAYAAADVEFLGQIYPQLEQKLRETGRLTWLQEDCARQLDPARYIAQPEQAWRRLKGLVRLDVAGQHVAAELAAWRERVAEERDRPRKWILADDALYLIAERRPVTSAQLGQLGCLAPKQLERAGASIVACVEAGVSKSSGIPLVSAQRETPAHKSQVQGLQQIVRDVAADAGVPAGLIASRADLETIIEAGTDAPVPALGGWRRSLLGDRLLARG